MSQITRYEVIRAVIPKLCATTDLPMRRHLFGILENTCINI